MIKVILKDNVPGHGSKNDIVDVSEGFARNFLLPKNKAVLATPDTVKKIQEEKHQTEVKEEKIKEKNLALKSKIETLKLELKKKAKEGKLFGKINTREISESLAQKGLHIDPKKIIIDNPLNTLGEYKVGINLDKGLRAELTIIVTED